jgi:hypothetical protein
MVAGRTWRWCWGWGWGGWGRAAWARAGAGSGVGAWPRESGMADVAEALPAEQQP